MRLTNSAVLLAYCCSRISERTPTESHQSKHGLLFFTLEIIINDTVHNGTAMFDNCTTILSHYDDEYHRDKRIVPTASYFDLQHIQRYRFSSQNGQSC